MVWVMPSSGAGTAARGDPPRLTLWCRVHVHVGWRANPCFVPAAACGKRTGRPDLLFFVFFESFSAFDFAACVCLCVCEGRGGGVIHFNQPGGCPCLLSGLI
ncbi:unnamed protein product [Ectocarpus fasciculatus]